MKYIIGILILAVSYTVSTNAQNIDLNVHNSIDLYNGFDQGFYSGTNFGVKNPLYSAYPVVSMIRHNRVDGLFVGYQEDKMNWQHSDFLGIDNVDVHGLVGYSLAQKNIQYALGAEKSIGNFRKWLLIGGQIHNTTATEDYWRSGLYENSFSSLTTGFDFHDYYNAEGYGVYALLKPFRKIELGISYNENIYGSLDVHTDYALISKYSTYRSNPSIDPLTDQIEQQAITLGLTLNPDRLSKHNHLWTTFSAKAEIADLNGMNNDFMYNRYQVEAKTFMRLDRSTVVKWRLMAGSITGAAPRFKQFAIGGIGTMRALGYKSLTGNEMVLSNFEIELGKRASKKNGWADLSSMYLTLFLDSGASDTRQELFNATKPFTNFGFSFSDLSHNAGIGIGTGMFRIELAKPIAGVTGQSSFWIRFNPTF